MRISRTSAAFALVAALTLTPVLAACTPAANPGGSATPTPSVDEAVDMARDVIDNGRHPDVRALVDDIIASQQAEIELMTEWLDR